MRVAMATQAVLLVLAVVVAQAQWATTAVPALAVPGVQVRPHPSQGLLLLAGAAVVVECSVPQAVLAVLAAVAQRALVEYRLALTEPQTQAAAVAAPLDR
jgi:hypothetical protein